MKNIRVFYLNIFQFLEVKFSIYLNRRVFEMLIKLILAICPNITCRHFFSRLLVIPNDIFFLVHTIL